MNIEYYFGKKTRRCTYGLYRKYIDNDKAVWYKAGIYKGEFKQWNPAFHLPLDMKQITKEEAEEFLFEFCL